MKNFAFSLLIDMLLGLQINSLPFLSDLRV